MAYAAVISLKRTIQRLRNSSYISILPSFPEINNFVEKEIVPLQNSLENLDHYWNIAERVNALDGQIRDAVYALEDAIETHVSNQFLSLHHEDDPPLFLSVDFKELKQDFDSFREKVTEMRYAYIDELLKPLPEEQQQQIKDDDDDLGGNRSKMVGFSDIFGSIMFELKDEYKLTLEVEDEFADDYSSAIKGVLLSGMAGIGKTTLAEKIYDDPAIFDHFDYGVWVKVGPEYQLDEIIRSILGLESHEADQMMLKEGGQKLRRYLYESLEGRRFLIVLDDVWKLRVWKDLLELLPDGYNGSRVLLISRLRLQGPNNDSTKFASYNMRFLDKKESWDLLRDKVFGEQESCSYELEKAGKKIAEKCEGLPLTIVTVAGILSKADKTPQYWNEVAEKQNSVFIDAYEEMSKVLIPSYYNLPQIFKPCFLYMGVMPQDYEIPRSKLTNLWVAEGFLEPYKPGYFETRRSRTFEEYAKMYIEELVFRNVVIVHHKISSLSLISKAYNNEKYRLHSAFLHLCVREARRNKFLHVLNSYAEGAEEEMKSQRRLCIQNNVLFGIKDSYDSIASVPTARSLLCTGPYHQYHVSICLEHLRLLRILDALTIRFYEFPTELLKLIQLRYLAITYDENLPPSISRLQNLECFIVNRHMSIIKSSRAPSYLPAEIWDMEELKHLQIMGSDLPDPSYEQESLLPNLLTLLDVSPCSCTKRIFKRIPKLQKLGISIKLDPDNVDQPLSCFDHISQLHELQVLKCTIMNPILEVVPRFAPLSLFPSSLKSLSLSGFGYPWEEMRVISSSLPNLKVLKLRCYAFRGAKWETRGEEFQGLEYLSIEDSDLVVWTIEDRSFEFLEHLTIKHCYKLEKIGGKLLRCVREIEVVDCNPLVVTCAKQISYVDDVNVHSSWEDGKLNS